MILISLQFFLGTVTTFVAGLPKVKYAMVKIVIVISVWVLFDVQNVNMPTGHVKVIRY